MNNSLKEIIDALLSYSDITILTHIRPDGDTLGSAYALKLALESLDKNVQVVCESEISPKYKFLSGGQSRIDNNCFGKIVCVDVASPEMAGKKYVSFAENADLVIDHHATNNGYGKLNYIFGDAAACGEIILEIVLQLTTLTKEMANCLYTAISTDTGCFVYASTTDKTHLAAAQLITAGADVKFLNKLLFRTKSHTAFEIERRALDSLEYFYDNMITCMKIDLEWIQKLSATEDDIEGISSIPAQIEGVKASATFRQISADEYKVSVRTNGEIDGSAVCKYYGGGGHKMAAGCTIKGEYNTVKNLLAKKLFEGLN